MEAGNPWRRAGGEGDCETSFRRIRALVGTVASIITTFIPSVAFAAERFAAPKATESVATSPAGGLLQVTLALLLVLAAVFAAAWAMRRLRGFGQRAPGAIEILADVAVGQKERAVLVQIGKQQLLLGVAPGQVRTLHVLPENVEVKRELVGSAAAAASPGTHPDFKAILKRSLGL